MLPYCACFLCEFLCSVGRLKRQMAAICVKAVLAVATVHNL
jgi:hypothetical protein